MNRRIKIEPLLDAFANTIMIRTEDEDGNVDRAEDTKLVRLFKKAVFALR